MVPSFCKEMIKLILFYFCDISKCLEVGFAAVAQACKNENFDNITQAQTDASLGC
jgi:hypothetical protein